VWFTYGSLLETGIAAIGLSVIGITLAFHPTFVKDSQKTKWLSYVFVIGSLFLIIVAFSSRLAEKTYAPQAETLDINGNSNVKIGGGNSIVNFRYSQCASPNVLNVPVGACFDARSLSAEQVATIRSTVKPGAIIYIIPLMPGGLVNFAHDLAVAFSSVPQVKVTIDSSNVIINGSRGLLLQYDHDNSVAKSVFEALQKAGLNPQDLPNISGPIVFLKVAPQ